MECSKSRSEYGCGHPECAGGCLYHLMEVGVSTSDRLKNHIEAAKRMGAEVIFIGDDGIGKIGEMAAAELSAMRGKKIAIIGAHNMPSTQYHATDMDIVNGEIKTIVIDSIPDFTSMSNRNTQELLKTMSEAQYQDIEYDEGGFGMSKHHNQRKDQRIDLTKKKKKRQQAKLSRKQNRKK